MKTICAVLLALGLALSLCACSAGPAPAAPTPMPTPGAEPAPTPEPEASPEPSAAPERSYTLMPLGEAGNFDLDGDGRAERVRVWLEPDPEEDYPLWVKVTVNEEDLSQQLYAGNIDISAPDEGWWAVTDIDADDGLLELAIQDWGPSDDLFTHFYRYADGQLRSIGGVEGLIETDYGLGDIRLDGTGIVHSVHRLRVVQTWYAEADFILADGEFAVIVPPEGFQALHPTHVRVLRPVTAHDGMSEDSYTVGVGSEMDLFLTDDESWFCGSAASGDWLHWFTLNPENPFEVETPEGYQPVWDVFEGLLFAD